MNRLLSLNPPFSVIAGRPSEPSGRVAAAQDGLVARPSGRSAKRTTWVEAAPRPRRGRRPGGERPGELGRDAPPAPTAGFRFKRVARSGASARAPSTSTDHSQAGGRPTTPLPDFAGLFSLQS